MVLPDCACATVASAVPAINRPAMARRRAVILMPMVSSLGVSRDSVLGDDLLDSAIVIVEALVRPLDILGCHGFDDLVMVPPGGERRRVVQICEVRRLVERDPEDVD